MRLVEAAIDRYGPLAGWDPTLDDEVTVLSGPNEAGKTLYLEAMLQLLDPAVSELLEPPPRSAQQPVGRVVVETATGRHELDGETGLSDLTRIQPVDLPTVFVVRDSDLAMPDDTAYYTDLIEHLGEVHTSAIDAVEERLRELGRLTETTLRLSAQFDDAKPTREAARQLVDDIDAYRRHIEAEGLDQLHSDRLTLARTWQRVSDELDRQHDARRLHEHGRLTATLERYESAAQTVDALAGVTRDQLDELRRLQAERERATDAIDACEHQLDDLEDQIAHTRQELTDLEDEARELERTVDGVDAVEEALETYRQRVKAATGAPRRLALGRHGLLAGGIATGGLGAAAAVTGSALALGLGGVALAVTLLAGWVAHRANEAGANVDRAAATAVDAAQDAGLAVDTVDELAPAIESVRASLEGVSDRHIRTETKLEQLIADREQSKQQLADLEGEVRTIDEQIDAICDAANVPDVSAYADAVEERSSASETARLSRQRLEDALGEVEADTLAERCRTWRRRLEEHIAEVDTDAVSPDDFDEAQLEALAHEHDELARRRETLDEQLEAYDDQLDRFDERARAIDTSAFLDNALGLEGRSPAALDRLRADLDELIDAIDADADTARRAVEVLRSIRDDQQRRIADLFDPDGPASRAFSRITDGRYEHIDYDPETATLVARHREGHDVGVDRLSAGTADQLYLASRLSLADRLLGGEPGFLLLDDPLVTADVTRLERGFETLCRLADDGWQVVYLTAKREVAEAMVNRFEVHHERLESIV